MCFFSFRQCRSLWKPLEKQMHWKKMLKGWASCLFFGGSQPFFFPGGTLPPIIMEVPTGSLDCSTYRYLPFNYSHFPLPWFLEKEWWWLKPWICCPRFASFCPSGYPPICHVDLKGWRLFSRFLRAETLETVFPSSVFNDLNRRNHPIWCQFCQLIQITNRWFGSSQIPTILEFSTCQCRNILLHILHVELRCKAPGGLVGRYHGHKTRRWCSLCTSETAGQDQAARQLCKILESTWRSWRWFCDSTCRWFCDTCRYCRWLCAISVFRWNKLLHHRWAAVWRSDQQCRWLYVGCQGRAPWIIASGRRFQGWYNCRQCAGFDDTVGNPTIRAQLRSFR